MWEKLTRRRNYSRQSRPRWWIKCLASLLKRGTVNVTTSPYTKLLVSVENGLIILVGKSDFSGYNGIAHMIRRGQAEKGQLYVKMALTLALPLFGLDPEQFSTLRMKLLNIEREQNARNLPDSGRTSPSTGSESSGISSLAMSAESASVELTPFSSRPETPNRTPCKSQEKPIEPLRVLYGGRDVLNLGANIRSSFDWQMKEQTFSRRNIQDFINNRIMYNRLREQPSTKDLTKHCNECDFYESLSSF